MADITNIQNSNIYVPEETSAVTEVAATSATSQPVFKNNVEGQGNVDVAETNNTSTSTQATKRTVEELYKTIEALCTKYGLSFSEVKKFGLLERVAGCPQEKLLNLDNSEIQKILECLKAALAKLSPNGQKIDLETLAELAQDYNIAIHTGWTIEGFQKAQDTKKHESLKQRLERVYPGKSPEEALDLYFNNYFEEQIKNKLAGETDPAKREQIIAQEKKRQLQDFGRLLANSSDEEKMLFRDAIKSLYANNRLKGLESLFKSLDTQEARVEVADSCSPEYIEEIQEKEDVFGENATKEDITGVTSVIAENQSEAGRKDFHEGFEAKAKAFFEENKEIIARIYEKLSKNEALTPEEQAIKDKIDGYFTAVSTGELIGTAQNVVISADAKVEILGIINNDAFEKANYVDVLESTSDYIRTKKLPAPEEISELINTATNGNYEIVAKNSEAGIRTNITDLVAPTKTPVVSSAACTQVETSNATQISGSVGYAVKQQPVDTHYAQVLTQQLYNQTKIELPEFNTPNETTSQKPTNLTEAFEQGIKGIKSYMSSSNISNREMTLGILNSTGVGAIVKDWALDRFEKMNRALQRMTFEGIEHNSSAIAAANRMNSEDLKNMRFQNHYLKSQVENIVEEKEEIA